MTRKELQERRDHWHKKERRAYQRYLAARRRGHRLADQDVKRDDPRRVAIRKKRQLEGERYRSHRKNRREFERRLARKPILEIDAAGMKFLEREEGLRLEPYNDSAGHATIGIGHLIHHGPVTAADRRRYADFTREDAYALFDRDLDKYEKTVRAVTSKSKVRITQRRFNALVSLCFNIGQGGFTTSTVAKKLKAGDLRGAADAILMWKKPPELLPRRNRERVVFLTG